MSQPPRWSLDRQGRVGNPTLEEPTSNYGCPRSVQLQTFEQPCVFLPRVVSLDLANSDICIYVLWSIAGAPFQLPGVHLGPGLCAWENIFHLVPARVYTPGTVRMRRVVPALGESWERVRSRAVEAFQAEARVHTDRRFEDAPWYYWPSIGVLLLIALPAVFAGLSFVESLEREHGDCFVNQSDWDYAQGGLEEGLCGEPGQACWGRDGHRPHASDSGSCVDWRGGRCADRVSEGSVPLVTLNLLNTGGEVIGDCNASFLISTSDILGLLQDTVPGGSEAEIITFSGHPAGGLPKSSEAYLNWAQLAEMNLCSCVYLEQDSESLRALVQGRLLEGDVFLSAAEEEETGSVLALAVLSNQEDVHTGVADVAPLPVKQAAASRVSQKKHASLPPPSLMSVQPKGVLLAEQEVQGMAQSYVPQRQEQPQRVQRWANWLPPSCRACKAWGSACRSWSKHNRHMLLLHLHMQQ
eukprot:3805240-Amphidinium_carterae.1